MHIFLRGFFKNNVSRLKSAKKKCQKPGKQGSTAIFFFGYCFLMMWHSWMAARMNFWVKFPHEELHMIMDGHLLQESCSWFHFYMLDFNGRTIYYVATLHCGIFLPFYCSFKGNCSLKLGFFCLKFDLLCLKCDLFCLKFDLFCLKFDLFFVQIGLFWPDIWPIWRFYWRELAIKHAERIE